jgi:flagellin
LTHLPSDAIVAKSYGGAVTENNAEAADVTLAAGKKYVIRGVDSTDEVTLANSDTNSPSAGAVKTAIDNTYLTMTNSSGTAVSTTLESGNVLDVTTASTIDRATAAGSVKTLSTISSIDGALVSASVDDGLTYLAGSKTDGDRTAGTYTISAAQFTSVSGSGAGATFTVVVDDDGEAFVTVTGAGSLFADAETITIANSVLGAGSDGSGSAAAALVFTIDDVTATADRDESSTFSITSDDYTVYDSSGNVKTTATGATFTITTNASDEATVNLTYGGSGFAANDYIMIDGSTFSDSDNPSDLKIEWSAIDSTTLGTSVTFAEVRTGENAFQATDTYVIQNLGTVNTSGSISVADSDAEIISKAFTDVDGNALSGNLSVGQKIKFATLGDTIGTTTVTQEHLDAANALIEGMTFTKATDTLTADIEAIQNLLNRARVEAGSQYAALESAVSYTTDLTAQYELGYNTVNDVNFSAETAHLAKNQILQQAATAMLAQANSGQQGLLQLIQG